MSFPATYAIRYYKGDLYQFVIRPKTSAGAPFPISDSTYNVFFYISTSRGGSAGATITADASIDDGNITATIFPSTGNNLSASTQYFYDVSIQKISDPTELFTLLTGTISVTADITTPS
jgi:hypothetical protein